MVHLNPTTHSYYMVWRKMTSIILWFSGKNEKKDVEDKLKKDLVREQCAGHRFSAFPLPSISWLFGLSLVTLETYNFFLLIPWTAAVCCKLHIQQYLFSKIITAILVTLEFGSGV